MGALSRLSVLAAAVGVALMLVTSPAVAGVDATRPYVYMTPFYQPKSGTNATLHFTSGDDARQSLDLRRYNAIGGLLGSTDVTVAPKGTVIAFAGANSGAQMHIEVWSDSPAIIIELFFTDTASVTQTVPPSQWRMLGPAQRTVPDTVEGLKETMAELRPPVLALPSKVDAVQSSVAGLTSPLATLTPKVDALAVENAALRKEVASLRTQLRSLRALIVKRLPAKRSRRRR